MDDDREAFLKWKTSRSGALPNPTDFDAWVAGVAAEREYWAKIADELKLLLHSADARGLKLPVVQAKIVVWQHVSEPGYFSNNQTGALYDQMLENGWRPIYATPPGILPTVWQGKMKAIADATFHRDWDTPLGPNV